MIGDNNTSISVSTVSYGRKARTSSCCRGTITSSAPILCIIAGSCQDDI
ncbi:hypothetical protein E2C01_058474 [Portunus trituberculatus]|uniref:Uncharacterized protein n=1 Tax=Portunus trituberculatus TaxID=210409 RepID=A0A5B7GWJ5_PORTR|nr:hypothetical protein [Portunus trituberculatus]